MSEILKLAYRGLSDEDEDVDDAGIDEDAEDDDLEEGADEEDDEVDGDVI